MAWKRILLSNGKSLMCPNCKSKNCVCKPPSFWNRGAAGVRHPWKCKCNDCGEKWEQMLN